ncbi:MAG: hypothetical protein Kow00103_14360 [Candidatus Caldatribacteriota bacterium]
MMKKILETNHKIKLTLIGSIILLFLFSFTIFIFSAEIEEEDPVIEQQLVQLKAILDNSSSFSEFQKNQMLLPTLQKALTSGISFAETREIVEKGVNNSFDAYNMKKILDILQETKEEDLPVEPLLNKVNEGLAKNVDKTTLISVISKKAENLKKANEILQEAEQEGLKVEDGEEIIRIIGDSLENDVPAESLSWLIKTGLTQGKTLEEITEISEELGYLSLMAYDAGLSSDKINLLFNKSIAGSVLVEELCVTIQKNLETELALNTTGGSESKPSSSISGGATLPTSPTGEVNGSTAIGGTPAQEAGEAPTESGSAPTPSEPSEEEAPAPPPEN